MTRPVYLGLAHFGRAGRRSLEQRLPPAEFITRRRRRRGAAFRAAWIATAIRSVAPRSGSGRLARRIEQFRGQALAMLTNPTVADAFDISREADREHDRYGRHLWGQSCLLAHRLAEAGVAVITIDALAPTLSDRYFSWDDHQHRHALGHGRRHAPPALHGSGHFGPDRRYLRPRAVRTRDGRHRPVNSAARHGWSTAMALIGRRPLAQAQGGADFRGRTAMGQVVGARTRKANIRPIDRSRRRTCWPRCIGTWESITGVPLSISLAAHADSRRRRTDPRVGLIAPTVGFSTV